MAYCMRRVRGAYSLTVMTKDSLLGIRDPLGVRPLCIGKLDGGWVIASETCALDHLGATFLREVEPGEAVMVDGDGLRTIYQREPERSPAPCIFEHIYFARPDSVLDGKLVYTSRMAMGAELAKEHPVDADMVIGVPDSATAAAVGYSQESGIPYGEGLVKNRFVGRTFIQPDQRLRDLGVRTKLNPLPEIIKGQRIVVVDGMIHNPSDVHRDTGHLKSIGDHGFLDFGDGIPSQTHHQCMVLVADLKFMCRQVNLVQRQRQPLLGLDLNKPLPILGTNIRHFENDGRGRV